MTQKFTRSDSHVGGKPRPPVPRPNVPLSIDQLPAIEWAEGDRFGGRDVALSRAGGAQQVHVNATIIPPGRQSCPFHYHLREEEHFVVLDGRCVLRSGDDRYTFAKGQYVCFPAGTGVGHAFENPFDEPCLLLAIGPHDPGEVAVYPDSAKAKLRATNTIISWPQESLDYWAGETTATPIEAPKT